MSYRRIAREHERARGLRAVLGVLERLDVSCDWGIWLSPNLKQRLSQLSHRRRLRTAAGPGICFRGAPTRDSTGVELEYVHLPESDVPSSRFANFDSSSVGSYLQNLPGDVGEGWSVQRHGELCGYFR